jgi:hypothetical protein
MSKEYFAIYGVKLDVYLQDRSVAPDDRKKIEAVDREFVVAVRKLAAADDYLKPGCCSCNKTYYLDRRFLVTSDRADTVLKAVMDARDATRAPMATPISKSLKISSNDPEPVSV